MRVSTIAFANLRAEMARENLGVQDIANCLNCNRDTASRKLSQKTPITLEEAFRIQRKYFPQKTVQFLFDEVLRRPEI